VVSFKGKTYVNMIRSIRESELERLVFSRLVERGIPVEIESNSPRAVRMGLTEWIRAHRTRKG
jgi:hypothetical protein